MIASEKQYHITKVQAEKFAVAIVQLRNAPETSGTIHPRLRQAEIDRLESILSDLHKEIAEYEAIEG